MTKLDHRSENLLAPIPPSDLGQAWVRVVLAALVFIWTLGTEDHPPSETLVDHLPLVLSSGYFCFALCVLAALRLLERIAPKFETLTTVTRCFCLVADTAAISLYTATASEAGVILLPVYITYIIGNGFRFGIVYFFAAMVFTLVGFSIAKEFNPSIGGHGMLVALYYFSIVFVPLYSLSLLFQYQTVVNHLKLATAELNRFIATMSHEFRAPLQTILAITESLVTEANGSTISSTYRAVLLDRLRIIAISSNRLLSMANRIVSHDVESNRVPAPSIPSNIYREIRNVTDLFAVEAKIKRLFVKWQIESSVVPLVDIAPNTLQAVLFNLVGNAIKYTDEGGVWLHVKAEGHDLSVLHIEVKDTGLGFEHTQRNPLPLAGSSTNVRNPTKGGLGMSITKASINNIGGVLSVTDSSPVGSSCVVKLPMRKAVDAGPEIAGWLPILWLRETEPDIESFYRLVSCDIFPVVLTLAQLRGCGHLLSSIDVLLLENFDSEYSDVTELIAETFYGLSVPVIAYHVGGELREDLSPPGVNFILNISNSEDLRKLKYFATQEALPTQLAKGALNGFRILTIDDSLLISESIRQSLTLQGAVVDAVLTSEKAESSLGQFRYDFVITDYSVDEQDGAQLLGMIRANLRGPTKLVLLTGYDSMEVRQHAEATAVDRILLKPVRGAQLVDTLLELSEGEESDQVGIGTSEGFGGFNSTLREFASYYKTGGDLETVLAKIKLETVHAVSSLLTMTLTGNRAGVKRYRHKLQGMMDMLGVHEIMQEVDGLNASLTTGRQLSVRHLKQIESIHLSIEREIRKHHSAAKTEQQR